MQAETILSTSMDDTTDTQFMDDKPGSRIGIKTAIVILNWNGKKHLEKFLPALLHSVDLRNSTAAPHEGCSEVIIADNASTDGSVEMLREKFPHIRLILLDRNYGFTGGYNRALSMIDAQYYLLLNSDVEVSDGWLEPLEEWLDAHHLCGACAPKLLSWNDREMFEYAGAAGGLLDRFGYPFCRGRVMGMTEKDYGQYDEPENVLWVSGACLMTRSELFHRVGGFDERFFAHQEEIDLCWRIQLEGYFVTVIPESEVYHIGGGTLPNDSPWKLELNYRNNLLMLENNLAKTYALDYFNENYMEPEGAQLEGDDSEEEIIAREAAGYGKRKASRVIFRRKCLDGLSALAYLFSFKPGKFKAVLKAHRSYRRLVSRPSREEIANYLVEKGKIAQVNGIFSKWIVRMALVHGERVFRRLRQEDI